MIRKLTLFTAICLTMIYSGISAAADSKASAILSVMAEGIGDLSSHREVVMKRLTEIPTSQAANPHCVLHGDGLVEVVVFAELLVEALGNSHVVHRGELNFRRIAGGKCDDKKRDKSNAQERHCARQAPAEDIPGHSCSPSGRFRSRANHQFCHEGRKRKAPAGEKFTP